MKMPFGKYKGFDLEELDTSYLLWVYQNCEKISPRLLQGINEELEERGYPATGEEKRKEPASAPDSGSPMLGFVIARSHARLFENLIEVGYKHLAKRLHPDSGGDEDEMRELNSLIQSLRVELALAIRKRKGGAA